MTCITAGNILRPPQAPTANRKPSSRSTIVGHMFESGRTPGVIEFGQPGTGSHHMIPLFIVTPVRGITTFEPNADMTVCVHVTILPSPSTAPW